MDPIDIYDQKCTDCVHYQKEHPKTGGKCTVTIPPWANLADYDYSQIQPRDNYAPECDLYKAQSDERDICGLCGLGGANKIPHPICWPGERKPDTEFVHDECEAVECKRAHAALTDSERVTFLASISPNRGV